MAINSAESWRSRGLRFARWPHWQTLALVLLFGLAVGFRLSELGSRDLWTDEAWVALAVLKPTPGEALAAGQSTPPFYVLTLWALARLLGGSEAVLRSLAFGFGVGTVFLFWPLARGLAGPGAALLGLATVACSPALVYYSKELKQYSGDAFFAVLVFLLVERLRARRGARGWLALLLAGLVGLGFSHTQVFILPVAAGVLWFTLPSRLRPRLLLVGAAWLLGFAGLYAAFIRPQVELNLLAYWAQDFPDFTGAGPFLYWLGAAVYRYLYYFLGAGRGVGALPLLALGGIALWRVGARRALAYLGGPLLLALLAAVLHRYPFMAHYGGNRLMLFSAPLLYLVAAAGLAAALAWGWRRRPWLALPFAALAITILFPLNLLQENLSPRHNREEIRPLVQYLEGQRQPGDWVYVYYFARAPFNYYYRGDRQHLCWGRSCVETGLHLPLKDGPPLRLWLIASHIPDLEHMQRFAAALLGPQWRETACLTREGAVLFCFEREGARLANGGKGLNK
jgi:4-amino-4-deoxy-L-arabinose transferase-like glycosyltransferase